MMEFEILFIENESLDFSLRMKIFDLIWAMQWGGLVLLNVNIIIV